MPVTIQLENPCLTAVLDGEIDHHCARSLREEIDQAILDYEPHQLRLDFEKVTFMDSSGIGLILGRCQQMQARSGHVIIQNPPPHIRRVMRLSGMERIASIEITNVQAGGTSCIPPTK